MCILAKWTKLRQYCPGNKEKPCNNICMYFFFLEADHAANITGNLFINWELIKLSAVPNLVVHLTHSTGLPFEKNIFRTKSNLDRRSTMIRQFSLIILNTTIVSNKGKYFFASTLNVWLRFLEMNAYITFSE